MKKIYFSIALLAFFGCMMALIIKFGIKGRAINILKPSYFSTPDEIGAVIFRRFYSELGTEKLLVFGVPAKTTYHQNILAGLIRVAAHEGKAFDVLILDPRLPAPESLPPITIIPMSMNGEDLGDAGKLIRSFMAQQKHVIVYTYSTMSSHLLQGNSVFKLEKDLKQPVFSITTSQLSLRNSEEYDLDPPCVGAGQDSTGTADLGCVILQTSRSYYRRNLDATRYVAVIDQHGRSDFLLLTSGPKDLTSKAETPATKDLLNSQDSPLKPADPNAKKPKKSKYYDGSQLEIKTNSDATTVIDPNEKVEEDYN
jgi:hypothetical protein